LTASAAISLFYNFDERERPMSNTLREAFFEVCEDALLSKTQHVSLYVSYQFYGGPEEGGWWGHDHVLVATKQYPTEAQANAARERAEILAKNATSEARKRFGDRCLREIDWLESRGLEPDFLPEVDGPDTYFVVVESEPGQHAAQGCRHYE